MKGCRPLTDIEVLSVIEALNGRPRDLALFTLGIRSGFRISELLSLRVSDVWQYGRVVTRVSVQRANMKGKIESRSVALHIEAASAIETLIKTDMLEPTMYLFRSKRFHNRPLSSCQAWRVLKEAYQIAELQGKVATHTMRKTFADRVYKASGRDIFKTQKALGHKNLDNTVSYVGFDQDEIDDLVLKVK